MWVCKANMLGDGLAIPHHRWERVLLGRAGWMRGLYWDRSRHFPRGHVYIYTPRYTPAVCMLYVPSVWSKSGGEQGAHPRCQHGAGAQHAGGTPGDTGRARSSGGAGSIRVRTCCSAPGRGDFLHLFFWGAFGWGHLFLILNHVWKKKSIFL